MNNKIFKTNNDLTGLIIRLTIGLILFPHGAQKLLGMFGGYGFSGTMGFFTSTMHLPWIIAFLVIIIEFFGSLSFIAGFASRIWAILTIILMVGIIATSHIDKSTIRTTYFSKTSSCISWYHTGFFKYAS